MTRVDVQTTAPVRSPGAQGPDAAGPEGAGDAFERCFQAVPDKGGRGRGEGRGEGAADPLLAAADMPAEAAGPAKALSVLSALVFDLGRAGGPPIRDPAVEAEAEASPQAPEATDIAALLAGAVAALDGPAKPASKGHEGGPKEGHANGAANASAIAKAMAADGSAVAETAGLEAGGPDLPGPRGMPPIRFPGAADLSLAVKAPESEGPMKATVLSQATHFAPVLGAANIQAIADAVTNAAPERAPVAFGSDLASTDPLARGAASPVKMLTIQLEPVSLGKVTLAIRLTGDGLRVDVMAADPKVVPLLNQDKELIMDAIRRSGVVPDVVTIQAGDAPARLQPPGIQGASPGDAPSGGGSNGTQAGGRDGASGGSDRRDHPGGGTPSRRPQDEDDRSQRALRGDLYL